MSQIETSEQLRNILDNIECISRFRRRADGDFCNTPFSYRDIIFVIEEIDRDKKKVCWRRTANTNGLDPTITATTSTPHDTQGDDREGARADNERGRSSSRSSIASQDPLELDTLLPILDGGCPAPGRLIVATTNQREVLDPALVRPGRMKKIRLDNLEFSCFKEMLWHYRPNQARGSATKIPIRDLWSEWLTPHVSSRLTNFRSLK